MRLSDMRPRRDEAPLPDDVVAELEALDAALRGEEVPAGSESLAFVATELRRARPDPDPGFSEALDAWQASGFERRGGTPRLEPAAGGGGGSGARGLLARLGAVPPRRVLAPVGAAVTLVVVAAVAVSTQDFGGDADETGGGSAPEPAVLEDSVEDPSVAPEESEAGGAVEPVGEPAQGGFSGGRIKGALDARRSSDLQRLPAPILFNDRGPAGGQEVRRVQRDAQLTLAAPAEEVQEVTNEAIGVVDRHRGTVLSSQSTGTDDAARATLELVIPTRNLDAALDELSGLADVTSLSEGSVDITRPFVDAQDRLRGLRAERRSLVAQIQAATTEEQLDRLRARHEAVLEEIARAQAEFDDVQDRARLANVTLQITSEGADEGDWSLEDALDDAGRVLTVGAGIALISGAVLLPLALIAAIAWFVASAARRRARERALDE